MKKLILLFTIIISTLFSQSTTVLPSVFNIQGVLRTATGKAATDGTYQLMFYIYNVERGGSRIGESNANVSIEVKNGIYNALVGERNEFADLPFNTVYFIGISVNGGEELSPRIRLTASPYALSVQGVNNKMPSSGQMQFDKDVWHKSSDGRDRIKFVNNGETQINSRVKDQYGFLVPVGTIVAFAGLTAPAGWLLCDGAIISRSTYSDLFAVIGTIYNFGTVGGSSFRLPFLSGKSITGVGVSPSTAWNASTQNYSANSPEITLGQYLGTSNHALSLNELTSHTHKAYYSGGDVDRGRWTQTGVHSRRDDYLGKDTEATGGSAPFNIMPPTLGLNYIIKY